MMKKQFIDWLRQSGNPDDVILAALLEENIIEMPRTGGIEEKCGEAK